MKLASVLIQKKNRLLLAFANMMNLPTRNDLLLGVSPKRQELMSFFVNKSKNNEHTFSNGMNDSLRFSIDFLKKLDVERFQSKKKKKKTLLFSLSQYPFESSFFLLVRG